MKLLITGSNGMLAQDLIQELEKVDWAFHAFTKKELDITQPAKIAEILQQIKPDALINCAAYTQVDQAEEEALTAKKINHEGAANLARYCAMQQVKLIHLSTDFVFDGMQTEPYSESDAPNPSGVYGQTKRAGEISILEQMRDALIIRTSWLFGASGKNFVKTMLRLARSGSEIKVVDDQIGSPTWTVDLAKALIHLLQLKVSGIVHFSNRGECSWHELAAKTIEIAHQKGMLSNVIKVRPIPGSEYPTPAKRPAYSSLNCAKYQNLTGKTPPCWQASLTQMLEQLSQNS
ncbi:MAG: dTDP-4-dehydrorhamnose reductase [SAR324 cluster bacterium]|nr:dTDP-4-dehydrorhamnose reductase [SAR324 cluster bacterium]